MLLETFAGAAREWEDIASRCDDGPGPGNLDNGRAEAKNLVAKMTSGTGADPLNWEGKIPGFGGAIVLRPTLSFMLDRLEGHDPQ